MLPNEARGIEADNFAVEFLADNIIVIQENTGDHYTLHFGGESDVLDVHRTWKDADGREKHQTVFAIQRTDIPALLNELIPLALGVARLVRPLCVGWLYRNNIDVIKGLDPVTDEEIAAVTSKSKRRRRLNVDEQKLRDNVRVLEYLDDIWGFPDGSFSLFSGSRRIGMAIKATDPDGKVRLHWFKLRDVNRLFNSLHNQFFEAALRYAIPREKYHEYDVLEP